MGEETVRDNDRVGKEDRELSKVMGENSLDRTVCSG